MNELVLSLFPGIGLLDMAFEAEGFCIVRGPDLLWGGDIRRFHPPAGKFEGVIGGPPCQQFSPLIHMLHAIGLDPKHPNMIPDYERVVAEAGPLWFLMENVSGAPLPIVGGYTVSSFLCCPTILAAEDGFGHEQRRERRFSFGVRGGSAAPDLRQWILYAALELPEAGVNNSAEAHRRVSVPTICSHLPPGRRVKTAAVLAGHGPVGRGNGYLTRQPIGEMCRLQGLPENFCDTMPFTAAGKRQIIGNGVPLPMGRAVARAVRRAIAQ